MSRLLRGIATVSLTAGLLTALELPALAGSVAPSAVSVTITTKSKLPHITGDTVVVFKVPAFSKATISGTITGAASGDVAILLARRFPFKHQPVAIGTPITLGTSSVPYSFKVAPITATRYTVEVKTGGPTGPLAGKSAVRTVYVTTAGRFSRAKACARPVCTQRERFTEVVPATARKRESAKHLFFYFGLRLSRSGVPPRPKQLKLDTHAKITKAKRLSATRFERTITWSFVIGNHGYNFLPAVCTRDTESKDGIGLPGHHHCGAKRISTRIAYLG